MSWTCPRCQQPVFFAEKVSSLGKNWHRFCLKCEHCHSVLSPGGHAEHNGRPYCHRPCYGALFGPRGVNIGGVGSYLYNSPTPCAPLSPSSFSPPRPSIGFPQGKKSPPHMKTFTGETSLCPGCEEPVYFAEKVMSLGRNWHRPCLRCQRCRKTLTAGSHAEVNREGMVVLLGGGRLKMGRQPSSDGFLSLCPSMMAFPIATSPAMATCLAPKVGSPTPDMWVWGNLLTTSQVVKHASGPSQFPPALSPAPPATPKAHGDKALSLRCEHW
ncbi:cysteine-rich protein 3 isoform X4 [Manis pentadactyla]|uniref:cysteine-rich protein 3 isoform X4 n=1 Tax=Manis pentadactyla TaxID=143292 RepID=UPI00255C826A|nr:cysteine-rich protein 3 isoform X4 [Manis pentadactyla]